MKKVRYRSFVWIALVLAIIVQPVPGCRQSGHPEGSSNGLPERVVSLSPNLTQIIFALGAEEKLVGVDDYSVYPPAAAELPRVGNYLDPDLERLIAARPDLVLVVDTDERMTDMLSGLGIEHEDFGNDTIRDILESIGRLGTLLDREERARELVGAFDEARAVVETGLERVRPVRVALVVGRNPGRLQDIYVAGSGNFLGELIKIAGGENVFGRQALPWPQIGVEALVGSDPDVIIDSTLSKGATDEAFEALRQDWNDLPSLRAVQNDRIIVPREGWFQIPGAYLDSTLMLIAHWLHPEVFPEEVSDPDLSRQMPAERSEDE